MKNKPLKDLDWFSFTSDLNTLDYLSIYQAIAYILRNEAKLISIGKKYERLIHSYEVFSAQGIYYRCRGKPTIYTIEQYDKFNNFDIHNLENEIAGNEDIKNLRSSRIHMAESMNIHTSIIYSLLQSEIKKYQSDENITLRIITKPIGGYDEFYFNTMDLKNWKSVSIIKELGLLKRRVREDTLENQQKIIGMLMHLLANQPLSEEDEIVDFTVGSGVTKPNNNKIYSYFEDKYLDKDKSEFPCKRTVAEHLTFAYALFQNEVTVKK